MAIRASIYVLLGTGLGFALALEDGGSGVVGKPYDLVSAFEQGAVLDGNVSDASLVARQGTGRCYTSRGERFDCADPAIDSCCNGASRQGCCDGTKQTKCFTSSNGEGFCCYYDSTQCGSSCCAYGWTCCNAAAGTCCSNSYGQCCGSVCCADNRQCCGGTCCNVGFECGQNRGACVRKTTPVLTVTRTTVVGGSSTNVADGKRVGVVEVVGIAVAAAGLL